MKNLTSKEINSIKKTTIEAALAAGAILKKYFQKKLVVREKKGQGIVTDADFLAEEKAIRILKRGFPKFSVLAEESGYNNSGSSTNPSEEHAGRWVLDPLDGTTNFAHGFPMFCVSIAAEWRHQVIVGVIYHPIFDDLYVAVKGKGATLNRKKMSVSGTRKLQSALLTTGFAYRTGRQLHSDLRSFEELSGSARAIRRPGSAALDLAYTARGVFDAFWERGLAEWDVAAGSLLVEEAGGKVTDFQGRQFSIESPEILASNKRIHALISRAVSMSKP